jgi:hypothetical protein
MQSPRATCNRLYELVMVIATSVKGLVVRATRSHLLKTVHNLEELGFGHSLSTLYLVICREAIVSQLKANMQQSLLYAIMCVRVCRCGGNEMGDREEV